jgi:putative hydrolase of the HAD superfamily
MPIRAIIFDRDGVLTSFDMELAVAFFQPLLPIALDELFQRWQQWGKTVGFPRSVAEEQSFWYGFWNRLSDDLALAATVRSELHRFDYTTIVRPFPDAKPALIESRKRGLHVGVLSNFSLASLDASLTAAGLSEFVDVACAAMAIGAAKPDPASYLSVTRALKVAPDECLLFDDEIPCVKGAQALGIQAYLVDRRLDNHALSQGIVRDLSALPTILADSV